MVEVKNLVKRYGNIKALDDISFSVKKGEILGFLGDNGAGKSTTLNIITGYLYPGKGTVTIDGEDVLENPLKARKKIGYLPEIPPLYLDMTVLSYLKFVFDLKKIKTKNKEEHVEKTCQEVGILDVKKRLIKNLSKGYKQRVGLASALLGEPPIIILDEPSVGLDPRQVVQMRELIKNLGKEHTVILSSHILSEVQEICSRILIINKGKIVANDSTDGILKNLSRKDSILIEVEGDKEKVLALLGKIDGIAKILDTIEKENGVFEYTLSFGDIPKNTVKKNIFFSLAKESLPILNMKNIESNLENVFLELTDSKASGNLKQEGFSEGSKPSNLSKKTGTSKKEEQKDSKA